MYTSIKIKKEPPVDKLKFIKEAVYFRQPLLLQNVQNYYLIIANYYSGIICIMRPGDSTDT
jgi:hypothetical protein